MQHVAATNAYKIKSLREACTNLHHET